MLVILRTVLVYARRLRSIGCTGLRSRVQEELADFIWVFHTSCHLLSFVQAGAWAGTRHLKKRKRERHSFFFVSQHQRLLSWSYYLHWACISACYAFLLHFPLNAWLHNQLWHRLIGICYARSYVRGVELRHNRLLTYSRTHDGPGPSLN